MSKEKVQILEANHPIVSNCLEHYARFPLQSIWQKTDKKFYSSLLGLIAYEEEGDVLVVAGDPIAINEGDEAELLEEFKDWAHDRGQFVCGYYFSENLGQEVQGMSAYLAGVSRLLNLTDFNLNGFESRDIRRALNQGRRTQLDFIEIAHEGKKAEYEVLKKLETEWVKTKRGPRIGFLLGPIRKDFVGSQMERWFVIKDQENNYQAFVSVLPYGNEESPSYYIDQLIQFVDGHKFALDFLLSKLILQLQDEKVCELSLGFNAFQKIKPKNLIESMFWANGFIQLLYKSKGLYSYKRKFTTEERKRYLLIDEKCPQWKQVLALVKSTYRPH